MSVSAIQVDRVAAATVITRAMVDAAFRETAMPAKPPPVNSFCKGDFVVYPTHGVGRIDRVGPDEIAGHRLDVIQISFAENGLILRIPTGKAHVVGLRKLADPDILADALTTMKGRPRVSRLIWARRAQEYQAKINSGDLKALAEVARDLQCAADGSQPSFSQRNLFELAIDRIAGELAAVSKTDKSATVDHLIRSLRQGGDGDAAAPAQTEVSPS